MTRIAIDSLVRGRVGSTDRVEEMRVFRIMPSGAAAGINDTGRQRIMQEFEVIGEPRPERMRRDIPEKLR